MRLVDVADIEKFISEKVTAVGDDHILLVVGNDSRWHEALPFIKTAYDVDKVVEQLGERSMLSRHIGMVPLKEAIEIVKRGGKEQA